MAAKNSLWGWTMRYDKLIFRWTMASESISRLFSREALIHNDSHDIEENYFTQRSNMYGIDNNS